MTEIEFISCLLFLLSAVVCGSVIQWIHSRINFYKPPVSILWFIFGISVCTIEIYLVSVREITVDHDTNPMGLMSLGIAEMSRLSHYALYFVILPLLLYDATQMVDWYYFKKHLQSGVLLAVVGVILQVCIIGSLMQLFWSDEMGLAACFMVAAAVGATDPIAVISLLEEMDAPAQLVSIFDSESLINDGSAIFLFSFFRHYIHGENAGGLNAVLMFCRLLFVGPLWGYVVAAITYRCIKHYRIYSYDITLLVLCTAYLVFVVAEHYFHTSGPLAIVAYGLYFKAYARAAFEKNTHMIHNTIVRGVSTGFTSIVFIVSGIACTRILYEIYSHHATLLVDNGFRDSYSSMDSVLVTSSEYMTSRSHSLMGASQGVEASYPNLWHIPLFFGIVQLARFFMICLFYVKLRSDVSTFSWKHGVLVWWGGLRGAVCLILALLLEQEQQINDTYVPHVTLYIASFTVLSLLINGTTFELIYKWLNPIESNPFKEIYLERVLHLIEEECDHEIARLDNHWLFGGTNVLHFSNRLVLNLNRCTVSKLRGLVLPTVHIESVFKRMNVDSIIFARSLRQHDDHDATALHESHSLNFTNARQLFEAADQPIRQAASIANLSLAVKKSGSRVREVFGDMTNREGVVHVIPRSLSLPGEIERGCCVRSWEKEGETIAMVMNCTRNMYKSMHENGFLSGTHFISLLSNADTITDYSILDQDNHSKVLRWRELLTTPNLYDEAMTGSRSVNLIQQSEHNIEYGCFKRRSSVHVAFLKSLVKATTPFDIEWNLLCASLRCIRRRNRLFERLKIGNSAFERCIVKLWSFLGPRQNNAALDDLQALMAFVEVHTQLHRRANTGLQHILGQKLYSSFSGKIEHAKDAVFYLQELYPRSFIYSVVAQGAVYIINLKIQLAEDFCERGLLLESDKNRIIAGLQANLVRTNKFYPSYMFR